MGAHRRTRRSRAARKRQKKESRAFCNGVGFSIAEAYHIAPLKTADSISEAEQWTAFQLAVLKTAMTAILVPSHMIERKPHESWNV